MTQAIEYQLRSLPGLRNLGSRTLDTGWLHAHRREPGTEGRLHAITVTRVGQRLDREGNFQLLLQAPELQAGTPVLTTTLPRASTGLRVAVINAEELGAVRGAANKG